MCAFGRNLKFEILDLLPFEICHHAEPGLRITSNNRSVTVKGEDWVETLVLPGKGWENFVGWNRLARRAMRLDKCNVVPVNVSCGKGGLVILRQGKAYHYGLENKHLTQTLILRNCRNVLHQSIAVVDAHNLYFGEYGANPERRSVPVYRSQDGGMSWEEIYTFPAGKIKHIHGCYWDPVEEKIWVFTGDFDGECYLLCADRDFQDVEWVGDGGQTYRTCNAFFEPESIHWVMDSQLETSYHVVLDRKTRKVEKQTSTGAFPGPVWYIKRLADGYYLAATAQEIGPGVKDRYAHLMVSRDLVHWEDVQVFTGNPNGSMRFEHDGLPKRFFKFGVIGFPDGEQTSQGFYMFFEALKGVDGKTALCRIAA